MPRHEFRPILPTSTEPITPQVYRQIRDAIVTLKLSPGELLSEMELARQLGTSRQPVREAFLKLQSAGLVLVRPQRGTIVVKISSKMVRDARYLREALELAVVRRACAVARPPQIAALRRCIELQVRAAEVGDHDGFIQADDEFHRRLADCAELDRAPGVIEDFKGQMDRVRYLSLSDATPLDRLIAEHAAIADAVAARDETAAVAAMSTHLGELLVSLPELNARFPELFDDDAAETVALDEAI